MTITTAVAHNRYTTECHAGLVLFNFFSTLLFVFILCFSCFFISFVLSRANCLCCGYKGGCVLRAIIIHWYCATRILRYTTLSCRINGGVSFSHAHRAVCQHIHLIALYFSKMSSSVLCIPRMNKRTERINEANTFSNI